jgi:hypothetical protein
MSEIYYMYKVKENKNVQEMKCSLNAKDIF